MSDHQPTEGNSIRFLFPVIFLAIIAILALYIVRDNFNERVVTSQPKEANKDTRSDHPRIELEERSGVINPSNNKIDSTHRERSSQPELDSLQK